MKRVFFLTALLYVSLMAGAQTCRLKASGYDAIRITFATPEPTVKEVGLLKHSFRSIVLPEFAFQNEAGKPALPTLAKMIEVPLGEGLSYSIDSMVCDTIDGLLLGLDEAIVPAQPSLSKSAEGTPALVQDAATYASDAFCGASPIVLEEIGVARDRNLAVVRFNPIRWNPVTNQLIIVKRLTVSISQTHADMEATERLHRHRNGAFTIGIETLNSLGTKDQIAQAPIRYTIVAHSMFRGALDEFAAWKRRQGFLVDLVYTDDSEVGTSFASIKNYLKGLYDNATAEAPAPTFVLLVGDVAQIPAEYLSANMSSHYSDLNYCCWTGDDYLPDCYYGRFSAQNLSQLEPQISKTLLYEQYNFPDDSYLNVGVLIAGVDGGYSSDYAYQYADPTMDYIAKSYITNANGFSSVYYYKNNTSFAPTGVTVTGSSNNNSTDAALKTLYNSGCGWVNYSAHGDKTLWHKPNFKNSDVAQMTNNNKPQIMIGNCCLTNSFQVDACFGEALLRKDNNAGAVAYVGGSNSTYWAEDFYWSVGVRNNINNTCNPSYDASNLGMYDKLFHQHGEALSKWYPYMGSMIYAGNMAVQSSSSNLKQYYWQIYHLMGDPSLMPYIKGQAQPLTPSLPDATSVGVSQLVVTTEPNAYVSLKDPEGALVAAAFANATGTATLNFPALHLPGDYEVAIMAQSFKPYFHTLTVSAEGPYVSVTSITPNAELSADADISFNLTLANLGTEAADSLFVEFQSPTGQLLFDTVGWVSLSSGLAPDEQLNLTATGCGHIWGGTPDQTSLPVKVRVRWGSTSQTLSYSTVYFTVANHNLRYGSYALSGTFEESDSIMLTINNRNSGHVALASANVTLLCLDPVIGLSNNETVLTDVAAGEEVTRSYPLTLNGPLPDDRAIPFLQFIDNGFTTTVDTLLILFGYNNSLINFDDTTWGGVSWTQGTYAWELTDGRSHSGSHCARSRTWSVNGGNNCNSELSLTWTSSIDDTLSFYKMTSSENSYDFFRFYIDGQMMEESSGIYNSWSRSAYFIPAGTHTFKWSYEKDYSSASGSDCAWIDDISLPISASIYNYLLDTICLGESHLLGDDTLSTEGLAAGYHHFADTSETGITYLTLYLVAAPAVTIEGGDVTIRKGETVRLTASGAGNYLWSNGLTMPVVDVHPTETTLYSVTGYNGSCSATASTTITVDGVLVGIDPAAQQASCRLYPNPATHTLHIEGSDMAQIVVRNTLGQTVLSQPAEARRVSLDIRQLHNGLYLVQILDADGQTISLSKFLKR